MQYFTSAPTEQRTGGDGRSLPPFDTVLPIRQLTPANQIDGLPTTARNSRPQIINQAL
jgi:hypothetical protein